MSGHLPDTNVVIAVTQRGDRRAMARMVAHRDTIMLSTIVLYELYFGAFSSQRIAHNIASIDALGWPLAAFDADDARAAAEIRATLRRAGTPIGPYDVLLAGQALARDLTLVTNNVREFERVEGLRVEDWIADAG